jgi:hypothetical protein
MSSDFSIKPVGAPVATPLVQPASPAADEAVKTDLPAPQSVAAADAAPRVRNDAQTAGGRTSNHVILDRDAASVVYQVVDNRTSLVVKQFPDQGMLRRRAYSRALEQAREDAQALRIDRKI